MVYYKIPLTSGGEFSYPAGCILCCAFYNSGYMWCKFERVTEVGQGWVEVTESEFNVLCPEFQGPAAQVLQEIIAESAALTSGNIVITLPEASTVAAGTVVKFKAPCNCSTFTGYIKIGDATYTPVNAAGHRLSRCDGAWAKDAYVAFVIGDNYKAYLLNYANGIVVDSYLADEETTPMIQYGTAEITSTTNDSGSSTQVYFRKVFKNSPVVIVQQVFNSVNIVVPPGNVGTEAFTAFLPKIDNVATKEFAWIAIGT